MRKAFMSIWLCASALSGFAQNHAEVYGPDGQLKVEFDLNGGKAQYSVVYDGVRVLEPSPLGFLSYIGDYSSGLSVVSSVNSEKVEKTYEMNRAKKRFVSYNANVLKVKMKNSKGGEFTVRFQVSDAGQRNG